MSDLEVYGGLTFSKYLNDLNREAISIDIKEGCYHRTLYTMLRYHFILSFVVIFAYTPLLY